MWAKGSTIPELEVFAADSCLDSSTGGMFVKVRVGTETYGDENKIEYVLLHIAATEGDGAE